MIVNVERGFDDEMQLVREWKKLAKLAGVPIVENPRFVEDRKQRALAAVRQELGDDG